MFMKFTALINNYSPKYMWLYIVLDIYWAAKWRGKYPLLATNTDRGK